MKLSCRLWYGLNRTYSYQLRTMNTHNRDYECPLCYRDILGCTPRPNLWVSQLHTISLKATPLQCVVPFSDVSMLQKLIFGNMFVYLSHVDITAFYTQLFAKIDDPGFCVRSFKGHCTHPLWPCISPITEFLEGEQHTDTGEGGGGGRSFLEVENTHKIETSLLSSLF